MTQLGHLGHHITFYGESGKQSVARDPSETNTTGAGAASSASREPSAGRLSLLRADVLSCFRGLF